MWSRIAPFTLVQELYAPRIVEIELKVKRIKNERRK
jgi:hypothetical protein